MAPRFLLKNNSGEYVKKSVNMLMLHEYLENRFRIFSDDRQDAYIFNNVDELFYAKDRIEGYDHVGDVELQVENLENQI